jgi:hypothetical protein
MYAWNVQRSATEPDTMVAVAAANAHWNRKLCQLSSRSIRSTCEPRHPRLPAVSQQSHCQADGAVIHDGVGPSSRSQPR